MKGVLGVDRPFDHTTKVGSVKERAGDYEDALRNKKALVIPMILEAFAQCDGTEYDRNLSQPTVHRDGSCPAAVAGRYWLFDRRNLETHSSHHRTPSTYDPPSLCAPRASFPRSHLTACTCLVT